MSATLANSSGYVAGQVGALRLARRLVHLVVAVPLFAGAAPAETMLTTDGFDLFRFDSATPGAMEHVAPLGDGDGCWASLVSDPTTGALYSVTCEPCQIMQPVVVGVRQIHPLTGAVLRRFDTALPEAATCYDKDIPPAAGEMRLVYQDGSNRRVVLATEQVITDSPLNPQRNVQALAHRETPGGVETFGIASGAGFGCELVRLGGPGGVPPASSGEVAVIGSCGPPREIIGFDISLRGEAFAAWRVPDDQATKSGPSSVGGGPFRNVLFSIDLETGAATELGDMGFSPKGAYFTALTVAPAGAGVVEVPALDLRALIILSALLAFAAALSLRARRHG